VAEVDDQLPLNESVAYVLIALKDGEARHGGAIGKLVRRLSNGQVEIAPGNLYPMLKRLRENGLLDIADEVDEGGAARKRYCITGIGQRVLIADQERLRQRARAAASMPTRKPAASLVIG
jgi:DNA-binding PadR family transcriptional regulator